MFTIAANEEAVNIGLCHETLRVVGLDAATICAAEFEILIAYEPIWAIGDGETAHWPRRSTRTTVAASERRPLQF